MRRADRLVPFALLVSSLFAFLACESEQAPPGDDDGTLPTIDDPNARDGGADGAVLVPIDAGPGLADVVASGDACPEGELACGVAGCVDTRVSASHCGGCNKPCESGMCTGGSCVP